MFGGIDEVFAPGRRHLEDERNRLMLTREEEGDGAPGTGPIDLDSGVVVIRRDPASEAADAADAAENETNAEDEGGR